MLTGLNKKSRPKWLFYFGLSISFLCLWLAFRKMEWNEFWQQFSLISIHSTLIALTCTISHSFFMAKRWQLISDAPYWTSFWSLRISFFLNTALPARLGEPFRIFYICQKTKAPAAKIVGAMAGDRILDFISLIILLVLSFFSLGLSDSEALRAKISFSTILISLGVLSIVFIFLKSLQLKSRAPFVQKLMLWKSQMKDGLSSMHRLHLLRWTFSISLLGWLLQAFTVLTLSKALGIPLDLPHSLMVVGGIVLLIAIPASPGNIGTFELGAISVLQLFHVPTEKAASLAVVYHLIQMIPTVLIGAYGYYFHFLRAQKPSVV